MNNSPAAYPLTWPGGWPRTPKPQKSAFKQTLAAALSGLKKEVQLLGGTGLLLSSNVILDCARPADPAVVAYFTYEQKQVAIPCDRWLEVEGNIRAIALTIEAMRGMERWGAKHMIRAMFQGFVALPPPADWRGILGNPSTLEQAEAAYKASMKTAHPDAGGTHERAAALNTAIKEARKVLA
jgi:hypothetical protein